MDWDTIISETLVNVHWHDGEQCYRTDCAETVFSLQGETLA